jgi:hypothetical protein
MLNKIKKIACIGSRSITEEQKDLFFKIGKYLSDNGFYVSSGNAEGSDQMFAAGVNNSNPRNLILYLPWTTYNASALIDGNRILGSPKPE